MSLLSETKTWLSTEKPDREEILLTIDNLSHEYGRSSPERRAELNKCIALLCGKAGLDSASVNLEGDSPAPTQMELDASPLGEPASESCEVLPAAAKARIFAELKDRLARPF